MTPNIENPLRFDCGCGEASSPLGAQSMKSNERPACDAAAELLDLGSRFLKQSLQNTGGFLRQASGLLAAALPKWEPFPLRRMCEIPETKCPPRCLGTIYWQGCNGATLTHSIRLTNTSNREQTFALTAVPWPGNALAPILLVPGQFEKLAGGATGTAEAKVTIPDQLPAGHFQTKILVTGAYEQYIDVLLCVCGQQQGTLEIAQGDIPTHIRAHRWYHHFQCVEPCFPPAKIRLPDDAVNRPNPSIASKRNQP